MGVVGWFICGTLKVHAQSTVECKACYRTVTNKAAYLGFRGGLTFFNMVRVGRIRWNLMEITHNAYIVECYKL